MYQKDYRYEVSGESLQAHALAAEFMACMMECSQAWCDRWPKVDTVILDPPEPDEDEDEIPMDEPEADEESVEPQEVEDGSAGDGESSGGYRYNSFL